mmetsp:Transcript_55341/g.117999  ORF Transcript_55341/g.117999 Transcript_55341/m.117999 type:complete len:523 (-) Transcript_55341:433-2001(-)
MGDRAKRHKANLLSSGLKPELHFKELVLDEVKWASRPESERFSAHADSAHNLFVSDCTNIVCFGRDGSYKRIVSNIEPHHIIPNGTADYVVILRKCDKQKLSKVYADGTVQTILESQAPLYGPDVCENGDVVHHPSTTRLERRSGLTGDVSASIEGGRGRVISFEANSYLTSGQDGHIYFSSKTCVYRWNQTDRTVECLVGHPKAAGRRDGFGSDARFTHLKRPVLTGHFAYVRENDNRFCRIDLETFEVSTLQLRGVDPSGIETYGITPDGRMMFLIFATPFRIFLAETTDAVESTFCADMQRVDWAGSGGARVHVEFIAGKDHQVYRADARILQARSTFFRSMLSNGMRESSPSNGGEAIELGEDVPGEALHALLHFLHTDHFEPASPPSKAFELSDEELLKLARFVLEVHTLADRFLLPRLARLCEVFLSDYALRTSVVLPLLAGIISPRRACLANLEAACWTFLEEHWKDIVQLHSSTLQELLAAGHPLVLELLQASSGLKRGAHKAQEEEAATPPAA